MKKAQLGARVHPEINQCIFEDALRFGPTRDGVIESALRNHFKLPQAQRKKIYRSVPEKIFGRPLSKSHESRKLSKVSKKAAALRGHKS